MPSIGPTVRVFRFLSGVALAAFCASQDYDKCTGEPYECPYESRCCTTPSGPRVCATSCDRACSINDDCTNKNERCEHRHDDSMCTTACFYDEDCRPGFECRYNNCASPEEADQIDDDTKSRTTQAAVIALIFVAILILGCCVYRFRWRRREQPSHREGSAPPVFILSTDPSQGDQSAAAPEEQQVRADVVQDSGPPPYHSLAHDDRAEPPPPSYDEAVARTSATERDSTRDDHVWTQCYKGSPKGHERERAASLGDKKSNSSPKTEYMVTTPASLRTSDDLSWGNLNYRLFSHIGQPCTTCLLCKDSS